MNMPSCNGRSDQGNAWIKQTQLFQRWECVKQEIMLHKWYESEKAGHDIGWERACVDWMIRYGHSSFPPSQK